MKNTFTANNKNGQEMQRISDVLNRNGMSSPFAP